MKRIIAGLLTVALMGVLLWSGRKRPAAPGRVGAEPGRGAMRPTRPRCGSAACSKVPANGDVAGYLDCFSGPLRQRLEREVSERGRDVFAADLKRAARSRKSHAIFAVEPEGADAARITVETVYPDRNERQTYHLAQETGGWLVNDVETVRSQVPKARYGTPASYQEPEGVPVQGLAVQGIPLRIETDLKPGTDDGTGTAGTELALRNPFPPPNP